MNIREIHEIISQIAETLNCPRCNAKILPTHIQVAEARNNGDYLFDVNCQRCQAEMSLSAHVERATPPHNSPKLVSRTPSRYPEESPISAHEVEAMKVALQNFCGSFIQSFG